MLEICSTSDSDSRPTPRLTFDILFGQVENAGTASRVTGSWGVKNMGVENTGRGKHGVWWKKKQGLVENTGCLKHGVWWEKRDLVENMVSQWKIYFYLFIYLFIKLRLLIIY